MTLLSGRSIARGVRALIATGKANVNAFDQARDQHPRYPPLMTCVDSRNTYLVGGGRV